MEETKKEMKLAGLLGIPATGIAIAVSVIALGHAISGSRPILGLVMMLIALVPILGLNLWQHMLTRKIVPASSFVCLKDVPYNLFWMHVGWIGLWLIYLQVFFVITGVTCWRYPGTV